MTRSGAALIAAALVACGGASSERFELSDGTAVTVRSDGDVALDKDGRVLWAMTGAARPLARTFDEEVNNAFGMWDFDRRNVTEARFDRYQSVTAPVDGQSVAVTFEGDGGDTAVLTLAVSELQNTTRITVETTTPRDSLSLSRDCDDDSTFYGFGAQYNTTDQRGEEFPLWVSEQGIGRTGTPFVISGDAHTTYFPMPYFLDARGFGVVLETTSRVEVDLCADDPDVAELEVIDNSGQVSALVFHGPTPLDVIEQLGAHVGRPAAPPEWALGVWIGAQGGDAAIDAIATELETQQIPATALWVQDWTGTRANPGGGSGVQYRWRPDNALYSNLAGLVANLRSRGLRFLAYANPFVDTALPDHFAEMDPQGLLIATDAGTTYTFDAPNGTSSLPDLTLPAARDYVKREMTAMVADLGFDGWMSDFGEWLPIDAVLDGATGLPYHNQYPVEWHQLSREVLDAERPGGDFALFARSGYTGVHGHSQIYWLGDQETSFSTTDGLPTVVPGMINLGLSGIPTVTHDIAGFSSFDGPSDKELYLRWTELGAFTPVMRTHEGNNKDDNWNWNSDAETIAHFSRMARVHQALVPELRALAVAAEQSSAPLVRHLVLHYPDDPRARDVHDQYLLGPDLLVAPIVTRGATSRSVYLPEGEWFHVFTGERYEGGRDHMIDAPIGSPPVFSRGADRVDLRTVADSQGS